MLKADMHVIRPMQPDDEDVIVAPWRHHIRRERPFRQMSKESLLAYKLAVIEPIMHRASVAVSCNPDRLSQVHGWACGELKAGVRLLHFVWVKEMYRGYGIATALVAAVFPDPTPPLHYTHPSRAHKDLARTWKAVFNPYMIALPNGSPAVPRPEVLCRTA